MAIRWRQQNENPDATGLGIIPGTVRKIPTEPGVGPKIPQMQWNRLDIRLREGDEAGGKAFEEAYQSITGAYDLIDRLIRLFYTNNLRCTTYCLSFQAYFL